MFQEEACEEAERKLCNDDAAHAERVGKMAADEEDERKRERYCKDEPGKYGMLQRHELLLPEDEEIHQPQDQDNTKINA